uniref:Uncharacterized protein n=1 Tax=Steinernema glaseri TaxID=37863 RepID=A0A1I7ZA48_9BILA
MSGHPLLHVTGRQRQRHTHRPREVGTRKKIGSGTRNPSPKPECFGYPTRTRSDTVRKPRKLDPKPDPNPPLVFTCHSAAA